MSTQSNYTDTPHKIFQEALAMNGENIPSPSSLLSSYPVSVFCKSLVEESSLVLKERRELLGFGRQFDWD